MSSVSQDWNPAVNVCGACEVTPHFFKWSLLLYFINTFINNNNNYNNNYLYGVLIQSSNLNPRLFLRLIAETEDQCNRGESVWMTPIVIYEDSQYECRFVRLAGVLFQMSTIIWPRNRHSF